MSRPRSVVEGILGRTRVSLAVTACTTLSWVPRAILGVLTTALDRCAHVALERRRHPRPEQPRPGDRPRPEPLANIVRRLDHAAAAIVPHPEHAQLLALAEPGRSDAQQPDPLAPYLRSREVE